MDYKRTSKNISKSVQIKKRRQAKAVASFFFTLSKFIPRGKI
jgi:hypothetical protein